MRGLVWLIFISYSSCLLYWMFLGFGRTVHAEIRFNYVPFKTILHFMSTMKPGNVKIPIINLAGNIGVFIPFGVMLPYLFARLKRLYLFSLCFIGSIVILELLQALLKMGTADVDDVIFNFIGGLIGYGLFGALRIRQNNWM
ncbi:VanZ family protein [Paenibacillus allorhizosphaerae]